MKSVISSILKMSSLCTISSVYCEGQFFVNGSVDMLMYSSILYSSDTKSVTAEQSWACSWPAAESPNVKLKLCKTLCLHIRVFSIKSLYHYHIIKGNTIKNEKEPLMYESVEIAQSVEWLSVVPQKPHLKQLLWWHDTGRLTIQQTGGAW